MLARREILPVDRMAQLRRPIEFQTDDGSSFRKAEMSSQMQSRQGKFKRETRGLLWKRGKELALFILVMTALSLTGHAQQTVFNVPTTDVLGKGKVYFEMDVSAKPNDSTALNKFSSFVPRLVVGAGGKVEVGVNILGNVQPGPDSTTISPTMKWKVYDGGDNGWAMVVGDSLYFPVRNKSYNAGAYAYTIVQKTFNKSTRVALAATCSARMWWQLMRIARAVNSQSNNL
jgi:hypothetical protein